MRSSKAFLLLLPALGLAAALLAHQSRAADHDDTDALKNIARHDARITDLHAFTVGSNLVIALSTNPTIPKTASTYLFPSDLEIKIHIDGQSRVSYWNHEMNQTFGGTIRRPSRIEAQFVFNVRFDEQGAPQLSSSGISAMNAEATRVFAGLRDDPFIRGPRLERNVAAIVIQAPLAAFTERQTELLIWATTSVPSPSGPTGDLGGRALRSQFAENLALNDYTPAEHFTVLGVTPDVIIFNTDRWASYPNGRALADDVVDAVADPRILDTDNPFPSANDRPFLKAFPYLADPHPACGAVGLACCSVGEACAAGSICSTGTCRAPNP